MIQPVKIQVRFADCDMMGHVNNAVYLNYFEYARVVYFEQLLGKDRDWKREGMILRTNQVEYLKPILLRDEPEITIFCKKIGTKSFILGYELYVLGELYATGESVLVAYNSEKLMSVELSIEFRNALEKITRN